MDSILKSKYTENRIEYDKFSLISINSEFSYNNTIDNIQNFNKGTNNCKTSLNPKRNLKMNSAGLRKDKGGGTGTGIIGPGLKIGKEKRLDLIRDALKSLYVDRTKPHLQELIRRLKERVDLGANYNLQMMIKDLSENEEEFLLFDNGEIYFRNCYVPENHWVDPKNPNNPYSREIWSGFLQYINNLVCVRGEGNFNSSIIMRNSNNYLIEPSNHEFILKQKENESDFSLLSSTLSSSSSSTSCSTNSQSQPNLLRYQFKGGRYGVAMEIHKAKISQLENLSLGELSHLVQLAINGGILQYENNVLKPRCTCVKIAAAALSVDVDQIESNEAPTDDSNCPATTINNNLIDLKYKLNEILIMYPNGILLSLLKRFFNTYWGKKLSPTVFGYTHISTLLLSDELKQTCRLYFDSFNHVIVQSTKFDIPNNVRLLEDEKFQKRTSFFDFGLFVPIRNMSDISFEYMRLLNK
ncbi:uncharacterized protein cubi_02716 [Cryptosporidium ubiquitum]|uniref:HTH OST-type domain-containing protein n=1 Tax=Cryptosporidium ubiquitum TaxID=857276 RepID=A0A1J4MI27_9CRYT|nr:uncharacterized protein cubi_02716 [Cryptosporidium ubiquitum]OII73914.1 hypothetical protein cubi_02716 [Cryptosporidium ubiquitum]